MVREGVQPPASCSLSFPLQRWGWTQGLKHTSPAHSLATHSPSGQILPNFFQSTVSVLRHPTAPPTLLLPESTLPTMTIGLSTDQLLPVLDGLQILLLALLGLILLLQIRLNGFVLCIEVTQILRERRERRGMRSWQGLGCWLHIISHTPCTFPPQQTETKLFRGCDE